MWALNSSRTGIKIHAVAKQEAASSQPAFSPYNGIVSVAVTA